jgi:O-antigen ligase
VKSETPTVRFPGSNVLSAMPVFAAAYILLLLPFLPDDGQGRIENVLFWPVAAAITLVLVLYNRSLIDTGFLRSVPIMSLAAYMLFAAASVSWAYSPDYSFKRLIAQLLVLIVILAPYALPIRTTHTVQSLHVFYALALAISAVYVLTTPSTPIGHTGYFTHKQELGMLAATGIILSTHELLFRGWRRYLAIVTMSLAVWLLFESQSKSNLAFSVFSISFAILAVVVCRVLRTSPAYIIGGIAVVSLFFNDPVTRIAYRLYGDATITGRTGIWEFINYQISHKAWLGWGFHSYWFVPNSPQNEAWGYVRNMPSSHSGYMELKLETGRIGYAIFLIFIYSALHTLGPIIRRDALRGWLFLSIAVFTLILNLLDSIWLVVNQLWMLYLIVMAEAVRYTRSNSLEAASAQSSRIRGKRRAWQFSPPGIRQTGSPDSHKVS